MVCAPQQVAAALDILPVAERHKLLVEWNATEAEYPSDRCIHELFEEQVCRDPEAAAVVYEDTSLSYGELNAKANRLAHHLIGLGVKPDSRVAICVERSLEMVVGLLAILKAGGAYVPLDPAYPAERLGYMLADSAPAIVLTHGAARARLDEGLAYARQQAFAQKEDRADRTLDTPPGQAGITEGGRAQADKPVPFLVPAVLDLEADLQDWSIQPATNPAPKTLGLTPKHLAYVIYTSGSTGQPKGVANEHAGLLNRLVWMQETYCID